jgi:hypothetical protein
LRFINISLVKVLSSHSNLETKAKITLAPSKEKQTKIASKKRKT